MGRRGFGHAFSLVKSSFRGMTYKTYETDLTGDVAESEGMVCGGIMRVLIEDDV